MPTFGFLIDNRKCIGCHACTVACKSEHQVPIGVDRTWVKYVEKGTFPHTRRLFTVLRCNHCDAAPCVTICPVTALFRRDDGVVDFDAARCIGCKACLQACPYDALYIDPQTDTAAKCNFCTHRLEMGLEPSCVAVCPEQAIVAGDLDDPHSDISQLIDGHAVQVRKPEKGTRPKLFYIEGDEAALVPSRTAAGGQYLWSSTDGKTADGNSSLRESEDRRGATALPMVPAEPPRRVYDVRPRQPAWGWPVAAYIWTKSLAGGCFLAILASRVLEGAASTATTGQTPVLLGWLALVFLVLTGVLLVADLKQPQRFLYVLLRPQWQSWLVRGAYVLTAYGMVLGGWLAANALGWPVLAEALFWPGTVLAVLTAVYTAFLLAQAKGRDLWQNPLLNLHLLAHALVAGSAAWLLISAVANASGLSAARIFAAASLGVSLLSLVVEIATTPSTNDAHLALHWIVGRPMGWWFWAGGVAAGHLAPLALLAAGGTGASVAAALLSLVGLGVIEWLWIVAPQRLPLS